MRKGLPAREAKGICDLKRALFRGYCEGVSLAMRREEEGGSPRGR